jgi:hypothetical protein
MTMQLTRIPSPASSAARDRVNPLTPAVLLHRGVHHPRHIVRSRNVGDTYRTVAAFLVDIALKLLSPRSGPVDENDFCALAREEHGHGTAITYTNAARRRAGHNRYLAT